MNKNPLTLLLQQLWHKTRNLNVDPLTVNKGSGKNYWWECPEGHEWEASPTNLSKKSKNYCPICSGQQILVGYNDLTSTHPSLVTSWGATNLFPPTEVTAGSGKKVTWVCDKNHEWVTPVFHRVKSSCPYCSGRQAIPGENDLQTVNPVLAKQWSPRNILQPTEVKPKSNKKVWWICPIGHEWEATVGNRTAGRQCSHCKTNKRDLTIDETASLIIHSWDSTNLKTPSQLTAGSNFLATWNNKCGHTFERLVKDYIKNPSCPYCNGTQTLPGYNDIFTVTPKLEQEWNYVRNINIDPTLFTSGSDVRVWWKCSVGHEWETQIKNRPRTGCPSCSLSAHSSKGEDEVFEYISGLFPEAQKDHVLIKPYHLDIYVPTKKIAIEYNGLYWHSEKIRPNKNYHYDKWLASKKKGVQLIQVWEDDWDRNPTLVQNMLANKLGVAGSSKTFARNTSVRSVTQTEANIFLNNNHIQGSAVGSIRVGLYVKDNPAELVALMVIKYEPGTGKRQLNLLRYATNSNVVGGFTKLLTHIEHNYRPDKVITFSDNTVSDGGLYESNGFIAEKELPPDYMYVVKNERKHKFGYRLKRFKTDPGLKYVEGLTEKELAELNGLNRIWDAGKTKWVKPVKVK